MAGAMKRSADYAAGGGWAQAPDAKKARGDEDRNLMVNFLPESMTEEGLGDLFKSFGNIERTKLMTDEQGRSRCFGFVKYEENYAAQEAITSLNGLSMGGKKLRVAFASRDLAPAGGAQTKVYISGFGPNLVEDQLRSLCEAYGSVQEVKILSPETHQKGVGFVTFSAPAEASNCMAKMDGMDFDTGSEMTKLQARPAKSRQDAERQQQSQGGGGQGGQQGYGG
eukprot:Hpha_TRINITY_DN4594_c0_g1::TRINITY_DN4594_c0_g1_i1::g.115535::m.115535